MIFPQRRKESCLCSWRRQITVLCALIFFLAGCSPMLRWQATRRTRSASRWAVPSRQSHQKKTFITVRRGETLYSIAFRNDLDFHRVAVWNHIGRSYRIYPGERIRLTPPPNHQTQGNSINTPSFPKTVHGTTGDAQQNGPIPLDSVPPAGFPQFVTRDWRWPIRGSVVRRFDPAEGSKGIDIAGHFGQPVVASAPGKVVYSGNALKGYGQLIIVKHSARYLSAYAYNSRMLVKQGQWVQAGQIIAEVGEGPKRRAELHFEIRDRGKPVNPLRFLPEVTSRRRRMAPGH